MKLTPWMLTVAAFVIIAALAIGFFIKKAFAREVVEVPKPEARTLPMAITEIEPGTQITRAHIGNGPWDRALELAPDTMVSLDSVIGRIAKEKITAATPLRGSMFYAPGDFPGITVSEGKKAVVVRISETTAVLNRKLKTGQFVDVQLTVDGITGGGGTSRLQSTGGSVRGPAAGGLNNAMTATLFKGVKVIGVNHGYITASLQSTDASSESVTLELDEEQARIALLAQKKGEIDLVFSQSGPGNGGIEIEASEQDKIFFQEILGLKQTPEKKPFKTEHFRGTGFSSNYFEDGERIGGYGGDAQTDGTRLQSNGGGGDWSTDTTPTDKQKNVAEREPVESVPGL
ncbi:MAG: Flp pilus assembly protein CpaB [Planctomycetaceae bacterium]|nr:Flp pilus assembly protein CpaB [Planctomycetaceae bacterium]